MRKLDIILRTCSNSVLEENLKQQKYQRISGQDRKKIAEEDKKYKLFSPIPSIAYHLAYRDPTEIRTEHLSWKHI